MTRINVRGHTTIIIGSNLFGLKKLISLPPKKTPNGFSNFLCIKKCINDPMVLAIFCQKKNGLEIFCQKTKIFLVKLWILSINKPVVLAMFFPKIVDQHFLVKNEKFVGKTLDFIYQRPRCFGNFFAKKEWIVIFFCQKIKVGTTSKLAKARKMRFWSACFGLLTL